MLPLKEMSLVASLAGASAVLVWRVQEGRTAVTLRKILIPPLGMATGFSMFVVRDFRIPLAWAACSKGTMSRVNICRMAGNTSSGANTSDASIDGPAIVPSSGP